jgi:toxin ParE1/3/4
VKVRFSRPAEQDVEEIGDWVGERDPLAALRIVGRIRSGARRLSRYPNRYPLVAGLETPLRKLSVANYLIFYRVGQDEVEVIRILHASRDWTKLLSE